MAWYVSGNNLQMCEGDYGLQLPVTVSGTEFAANDMIKIVFKTEQNGEALLTKEYTPNEQGQFNLEFTESESEQFPVGTYVYSLDWYQSGNFMCNIIPTSSLRVVDKA